jgi:hypothetical protein
MKLILITLLAFAGSLSAYADEPQSDPDYDGWGPNSYHGFMMKLHGYVDAAREVLTSDLNNSSDAGDFDEDLFNKILIDEQKLNAAIWHLQHPEDTGEINPYEPKKPKHH